MTISIQEKKLHGSHKHPGSSSRKRSKSSAQVMKSNQVPSQPFISSNSNTSLEIHCSPVALATRSLSSRSLTRSGSNPPLAHSLVGSIQSGRKVKSLCKFPRKREGVVADRLRSSMDKRSSSDDSQPPDMQKWLQDISSAMQSMGPMSETTPPLQQPSMHCNTSHKKGKKGNCKHFESSQQASKKARKPPKLAAKFDGHGDKEERCERLELPPQHSATSTVALPPTQDHAAHDIGCEVRLPKSQPPPVGNSNHDFKSDAPNIPHLNLDGSTGNQRTTAAAVEIENLYRNSSAHDQPRVGLWEKSCRQERGLEDDQASLQVEKVKVLLQEKKTDLDRSRQKEMERVRGEFEARERRAAEREQRRAAKLMADRKAAIEELQRRREEKKARAELLAQKEVVRC